MNFSKKKTIIIKYISFLEIKNCNTDNSVFCKNLWNEKKNNYIMMFIWNKQNCEN